MLDGPLTRAGHCCPHRQGPHFFSRGTLGGGWGFIEAAGVNVPWDPTAPHHRPAPVADEVMPGSAQGSRQTPTHRAHSGCRSSLGGRRRCRSQGHTLPPAHICTHAHSWGRSGPVDRLAGGNGRVAALAGPPSACHGGTGQGGQDEAGVSRVWQTGQRLPAPQLPADLASPLPPGSIGG